MENKVAYKVVTNDLKSLGLRKNPNILTYSIDKWFYLSQDKVKVGNDDWGGIWLTVNLSNARKLKKYMQDKYSKQTRIFSCVLDEILYSNSYRIKTNGVCLLKEIF